MPKFVTAKLADDLDWRLQVRRVRLDAQGYTECGEYYGIGQKLWEVTRAGNQATQLGNGFCFTEMIRAPSRKAAIAKALAADARYRHVRSVF